MRIKTITGPPDRPAELESLDEASRRIGLSKESLRLYIHRGLLRGWRVGLRKWGVDPAEVDALVHDTKGA